MEQTSSKKNPYKVGLTLGIITGGIHLLWMVVVALGAGKAVLDWIFALHHLSNPYNVLAFSFGKAVALVLFTTLGGYVLGAVYALLCNWIGKKI